MRAILSKLGVSQAEFSRLYALSPRSLQEWEHGTTSTRLIRSVGTFRYVTPGAEQLRVFQ